MATKAQLVTENYALRAQISELNLRVAMASAQPKAAPSSWAERSAAAKAEARRTGRCTKVN